MESVSALSTDHWRLRTDALSTNASGRDAKGTSALSSIDLSLPIADVKDRGTL